MTNMNEKRRSQLKKIIREKKIHTFFQPIISLKDQSLMGYEALSRGPEGTILKNSDILFETANATNMIEELEYLCHRQIMESISAFPAGMKLFINIEASLLNSRFYRKIGRYRKLALKPKDIILEITERGSIRNIKKLKKNADFFRREGFGLSLDDVGTGYNGLQMFWELKPDYLKLPCFLVSNIDKNAPKKKFVKVLLDLAKDIKAKTIAENVEKKSEFMTLRRLGADFAQGFLIARPGMHFPKPKKT